MLHTSVLGSSRARSEPGGTRWRTEGELKGKQANVVGSQYNSILPRNVVCPALLPLLLLIRTPGLPVVDWTYAPTNLNGLVRFGERRILVSAHVPSCSAWAIPWNEPFFSSQMTIPIHIGISWDAHRFSIVTMFEDPGFESQWGKRFFSFPKHADWL